MHIKISYTFANFSVSTLLYTYCRHLESTSDSVSLQRHQTRHCMQVMSLPCPHLHQLNQVQIHQAQVLLVQCPQVCRQALQSLPFSLHINHL